MKMKKVIAGVLASVVAVSAMATMAVSAAEVNQKEETVVFDLAKKGWKTTHTVAAEVASADGLTLNAGVYTFSEDVTVEITGKAPKTEAQVTKKYSTSDKELVLKAAGDTAAEGEVALGLWETVTSVKFSKDFTVENYKKEANAKADAEASKTVEVNVAPAFAGLTTFDLYAKEGKYTKMDDEGVKLDITKRGISISEFANNLGYSIVNTIGNKKGAQIVLTFKADEELGEIGDDTFGPELDYSEIEGSIKDLAIAPCRTNIFYKWDAEAGENVPYYTVDFSGKVQGNANVEKNVATFDWDKVVNNSGLTINSLGLVNDIVIGHKDGKELTLEKVEVKIPAKTVEDITLGEGVEETTPAPVETEATEATDAAETTAPVENPTTGNAPIALAVIPVAIVAAAIVAKKRG